MTADRFTVAMKTTYHLQYGSIAAMQYITVIGEGPARHYCAIYVSATAPPEYYLDGDMGADVREQFPLAVQAAVNRHFKTVFGLPVEQRDAAIRAMQPATFFEEELP